jgi:hypothetical protein
VFRHSLERGLRSLERKLDPVERRLDSVERELESGTSNSGLRNVRIGTQSSRPPCSWERSAHFGERKLHSELRTITLPRVDERVQLMTKWIPEWTCAFRERESEHAVGGETGRGVTPRVPRMPRRAASRRAPSSGKRA